MFELIRKFVADVASAPDRESGFAEDDYRLATAALLVHIANVDGKIDPAERVRLRQILEERFGLDAAGTSRLIEQAEASDREAVDFFHVTSVLKRSLDDEGRHRIITMLWEIVFADGAITEFEENVVWRIAELLGVPNRDRLMLRARVAESAKAPDEVRYPGPWSEAVPKPGQD